MTWSWSEILQSINRFPEHSIQKLTGSCVVPAYKGQLAAEAKANNLYYCLESYFSSQILHQASLSPWRPSQSVHSHSSAFFAPQLQMQIPMIISELPSILQFKTQYSVRIHSTFAKRLFLSFSHDHLSYLDFSQRSSNQWELLEIKCIPASTKL